MALLPKLPDLLDRLGRRRGAPAVRPDGAPGAAGSDAGDARDVRGLAARRRPRTPKGQRTRTKLVRFTPEEVARVEARARAAGLPVARYVREASLKEVPPPSRPARVAHDAIVALNRVGVSLNQLARVANATGRLGDERHLREVLAAALDAMRRLDPGEARDAGEDDDDGHSAGGGATGEAAGGGVGTWADRVDGATGSAGAAAGRPARRPVGRRAPRAVTPPS